MCWFSLIGMSNVANKKKFKRRRRWRSIMAWRQVPGAIASAIIPWQEVQWGSAVRVDWTQPIFQVLVQGGNHIIPTTFYQSQNHPLRLGGSQSEFLEGLTEERFDWCLKIAPDNFCKVFQEEALKNNYCAQYAVQALQYLYMASFSKAWCNPIKPLPRWVFWTPHKQPVAKQCYRKNTNDKNICFVLLLLQSYFLIVDVF